MVSSSHTRAIYNTPLHTKLRGYYERGGGWTIKARGHRGLVQNNVFPIHRYTVTTVLTNSNQQKLKPFHIPTQLGATPKPQALA